MAKLVRLLDLEKLSPARFSYENSVLANRLPTPCYLDIAARQPVVEAGYELVGWADNIDQRLMRDREGQIALMLFHPEYGEVWQHYPALLCEREELVFRQH